MEDEDGKNNIIALIRNNENQDKIKKYFKDRKWTVDDLLQTQYNKGTIENWYHCGKKSYRGMNINCNGVRV